MFSSSFPEGFAVSPALLQTGFAPSEASSVSHLCSRTSLNTCSEYLLGQHVQTSARHLIAQKQLSLIQHSGCNSNSSCSSPHSQVCPVPFYSRVTSWPVLNLAILNYYYSFFICASINVAFYIMFNLKTSRHFPSLPKRIRIYICVYTYIHTYMYTCVRVYTYIHTYMCTCVYTCVCTCVCVCIYLGLHRSKLSFSGRNIKK